MKKNNNNDDLTSTTLRQQAEQQVNISIENNSATADEKKLLHELQVHQIELEMMNEHLRAAQIELEKSWSQYFDLYDLAPIGYVTIDYHDNIHEANRAAIALLNLPRGVLFKKTLMQLIDPKDQASYLRYRNRLVDNGKPQVFQLAFLKPDASAFWVRLEMNRYTAINNEPMLRVIISDISVQKKQEEYLRQAAILFEATSEGVMVTDVNNTILLVNPAFSQLTGYPAQEAIGQNANLLKSNRQSDDFSQIIWQKLHNTDCWQGELWSRRKNGQEFLQFLCIHALRDEIGQVYRYVSIFSDLTEQKNALNILNYLAHHDSLTGLPNRMSLYTRMEHLICTATKVAKITALLIVDLDRFKDVNDSYGHSTGDELLQYITTILNNRVRTLDMVARLGGDEFALLLENLNKAEDAGIVAQEIIDALSEPLCLSAGLEISVGCSIGISLFPELGKTSQELMQQADTALYHAKNQGRGNFQYFSEDLTHAALKRIHIGTLLREALQRNEFMVYYQPQVEIATGRIIGVEALLRWTHPTEGVISPSEFIPIAEEIGLINPIGEWVLREATRQAQQWLTAGLPAIKLAVNLSTHQFRHGDIAQTVLSLLQETGYPPECLELELTESALMEREVEAVSILERLRARGIRFAIDDFGTGYSSFLYLKRFPLDILKIDKSFINDLEQLDDDKEIAVAIIKMAHTLRLKVLAEGVETQAQLDFLQLHDCDFYQGYLKSPALPAEALANLLAEGLPN